MNLGPSGRRPSCCRGGMAKIEDPNALGPESESESEGEGEGEVAEAPQPCTVEAMCKAKWPAQRRPTEARQAAAATRGLEGGLLGRMSRRKGRLGP
jgi:hypothetical protein